jgi:ATP-binding cassette subfamily C protein CydD
MARGVPVTMVVAGLSMGLAGYLYQANQQALAIGVARRYRERLFRALLGLPYGEIRERSTGEWMSTLMNDVALLQGRFADLITGLVKDLVPMAVAFGWMAWLSGKAALLLLVVAPFIAYGMGTTGRRIARFAEAFQRELARIGGAFVDLRARLPFVRAQQGEARELERFGAVNAAYYRHIRRSILVRSAFAPLLELLGALAMAGALAWIGAQPAGTLDATEIAAFLGAIALIMRPLRECGEQISRLAETRGALAASLSTFRRLREHQARSGGAAGASRPLGLPVTLAAVAAGFGGEVRFAGEDLTLAPGRAVAVIGPSGAGKSTLLKVLAGLVPPATFRAGQSLADVVGGVSMVSQEPFLFEDALRANLVYGARAGEEPSDAALWEALALVGLDAMVRERGGLDLRFSPLRSGISGGQLQRLTIARGWLKRRPVLALDEATSALDPRTEREITERLIAHARASGTALLAVTHRSTWLGMYDEVWFVESGRVRLRGTHAALMQEPRYRDYHASSAVAEADEPAGAST